MKLSFNVKSGAVARKAAVALSKVCMLSASVLSYANYSCEYWVKNNTTNSATLDNISASCPGTRPPGKCFCNFDNNENPTNVLVACIATQNGGRVVVKKEAAGIFSSGQSYSCLEGT